MKKLLLIAAAGCVLSTSIMADCSLDQSQIQAQIREYGSITTNADYEDGIAPMQLTQVANAWPSQDYAGICDDYANNYTAATAWVEGNWGNTILAENVNSALATEKVAGLLFAKTAKKSAVK